MSNIHNFKLAERTLDLGISQEGRREVAEALRKCLATSYVLYTKTQSVHWNLTGSMFLSVHQLTEDQYTRLAAGIDELAERMRSLGVSAPAGLGTMTSHSTVEDWSELPGDSAEMISSLDRDHQQVARTLRESIVTSEEAGDFATADLLTERLALHEEASWQLSALLA